MNRSSLVFATAAVLGWNGIASAHPRPIDSEKSTMTLRVGKSGAFSAFGHNHEIAVPIERGEVDASAQRIELHVRADTLRVRAAGESNKDLEQIQSTMLGPEVLDVRQYPEIVFRSTAVDRTSAGAWKVEGNLTLHGQTKPVSVSVTEKDGHYIGNAAFKQSEFGITPVRIAGGAVRVKDEVSLEFDIQLAQ